MRDYDKIILKNQSPFLLAAHNGQYTYWLHPFMADVFPYDASGDGKVYFEPVLEGVLSGTASLLTAAYYLKSETVQGDAYPAILSQFSTVLGDNPAVVFDGNLTSGQERGTGNVNPAAFSSYQLRFVFANGAQTATNFAIVDVRFYEDAAQTILIGSDTFQINASNANTYISGPLRSGFMAIFASFPGGTLGCHWLLSNRPVSRVQATEGTGVLTPPSGTDPLLPPVLQPIDFAHCSLALLNCSYELARLTATYGMATSEA
jgi:hypothetical protein